MGNRILIVGTYDTKDDELTYLASVIRAQGGVALTMDVSVLATRRPHRLVQAPGDRGGGHDHRPGHRRRG